MKPTEFRKLIREEVTKALNESLPPINHKVGASQENLILEFPTKEACQEAMRYYSQLYPRYIGERSMSLPIVSIARHLVKNFQTTVYNPKVAE